MRAGTSTGANDEAAVYHLRGTVRPHTRTCLAATLLHYPVMPPAKAFLYYQENDVKDRRLAVLQWLIAPVRGSGKPSTYRLLPYDGAPLSFEDLP